MRRSPFGTVLRVKESKLEVQKGISNGKSLDNVAVYHFTLRTIMYTLQTIIRIVSMQSYSVEPATRAKYAITCRLHVPLWCRARDCVTRVISLVLSCLEEQAIKHLLTKHSNITVKNGNTSMNKYKTYVRHFNNCVSAKICLSYLSCRSGTEVCTCYKVQL